MKKARIGIIGASGYWGRKLFATLVENPNCVIVGCSGYSNKQKLDAILQAPHAVNSQGLLYITLNPDELIKSDEIDALFISTPAETHYALAMAALDAGKHVFVEKPMCTSFVDAESLFNRAKLAGKLLFTDYTYLYSDCLPYIKRLIDSGAIGSRIRSFHSNRTQMGIYRNQSVLWDLAPHDISIIKFLFPLERIQNITATGWTNFTSESSPLPVNDSLFYKLTFESGFVASAFETWAYPRRSRDVVITGDDGMILFENNNTVLLIEHSLPKLDAFLCSITNENIVFKSNDEPLAKSISVFINCLLHPNLDLACSAVPEFSLNVCRILGMIEDAMK